VTLRQSTEFSHALSLGAERPADVVLLERFAALLRAKGTDAAPTLTALLDCWDAWHGKLPVLVNLSDEELAA
jgi:hypothetical protein